NGLRDPLAPDPQTIVEQFQLTEIDMQWALFQDLTPRFIEKRLQQRLAPPASVQLWLKDNIVYLQGYAPKDWIEQALQAASYLAGTQQVNHDKLKDTDNFLLTQAQQHLMPPPTVTMTVNKGLLILRGYVNSSTFERLQHQLPQFKQAQRALVNYDTTALYDAEQLRAKLIKKIEDTLLYFSEGHELIANQEKKMKQLVESIQHLIALTTARAQPLQIQITGNTDGLGNQAYNEHLSQQRAQIVMNHLIERGIDAHYLVKTLPAQIRFGEYQPQPTHRNVTLTVTVSQD
ncbi:MAG: OmpA family protein, partial [Acidobacteriota bacterium]|nr:OmpA family protein [Acidobacteriota bacterium]